LIITGFNLGGQPKADQIEEVVKLNYTKVKITYTPQDGKGQGMPPVSGGWNLQENKVI
jgi:type VI protein secretion system component Hcp